MKTYWKGKNGRGGSGSGRSNNRGGGRFSNQYSNQGKRQGGNNPKCQVYRKYGHIALTCYHRYNPKYQEDSFPQNHDENLAGSLAMISEIEGVDDPSTSMLVVLEILYDSSWYPDSGATNHVTLNSSNLMHKAPYNGDRKVKVANDSSTNIRHIGKSFSYNPNQKLTAFSYSYWGSDVDDRKSTSSYCIYLGSNLVSWFSKKQDVVSRSSTKAEYRRIAAAATELSWLTPLLHELQEPPSATPVVYCDNLSVVLLAANPILHSRTKHFVLNLFFVRDKVQQHTLEVHHIPALERIADVLTKAINLPKFQQCTVKLRVIPTLEFPERGGGCKVIDTNKSIKPVSMSH